jgi:hypothetical protein
MKEFSDQIFSAGYPTGEATQRLTEELQFQNAVRTYLWALPASFRRSFPKKISP